MKRFEKSVNLTISLEDFNKIKKLVDVNQDVYMSASHFIRSAIKEKLRKTV